MAHILACMRLTVFAVALILVGLLVVIGTYHNLEPVTHAMAVALVVLGCASVAGGLLCALGCVAVAASFFGGYLPVRTLYLASIYGPGRLKTKRRLLA